MGCIPRGVYTKRRRRKFGARRRHRTPPDDLVSSVIVVLLARARLAYYAQGDFIKFSLRALKTPSPNGIPIRRARMNWAKCAVPNKNVHVGVGCWMRSWYNFHSVSVYESFVFALLKVGFVFNMEILCQKCNLQRKFCNSDLSKEKFRFRNMNKRFFGFILCTIYLTACLTAQNKVFFYCKVNYSFKNCFI